MSAVSMAAIYASDLDPTSLVLATPSSEKIGMFGHIEYVQADSFGNIIGYYQTDNFVTDMGAACAATMLFDTDEILAPCDVIGSGVNEFLNIRSAMEKILDLPKKGLKHSWDSLEEKGNMSSVSLLDILKRTIESNPPELKNTYAISLAMGPGFSAEMGLFKWN